MQDCHHAVIAGDSCDMLYYIVVGSLLFLNGVQDLRKKTLHNGGLFVGVGVVLLLFVLDGVCSGVSADILLSQGSFPWKRLWGILPGAGVLVLSSVLRGSIGKGDGYLLCISGIALGLEQNMALLFYGLFLAGSTAMVLLILQKVKRDTKLPFVPFLFAGYILTLMQQYV